MAKTLTVADPTGNCVHLLRRKIPHTYTAEADSSDLRVEEQEMLKILKLAWFGCCAIQPHHLEHLHPFLQVLLYLSVLTQLPAGAGTAYQPWVLDIKIQFCLIC